MKIISVGKNTKNAEGIKIPGEVKKAFRSEIECYIRIIPGLVMDL